MSAEQVKPSATADTEIQTQIPAKTPEQEAAMAKIHERVFGNMTGKTVGSIQDEKPVEKPKEEKPDPKPADSKAGEGEQAAAAPKKDDEAKPARAPKKPKPSPTIEDITKAATAAATKAVADSLPKKEVAAAPAVKTEPEVVQLDKAYKEEEQVYRHLAATNPKYATLVDDLNTYAKDSREYMRTWQKENPGKKFNMDDDEHSEFVETHQPAIAPSDIAKASAAVGVKDAVEKEMEPIRKQREKEEETAKLRKVAEEGIPLAHGASRQLDSTLARQLIPNAFKEDGSVDQAAIKSAIEDPALESALKETIEKWDPLVRVAAFILRPGAEHLYMPENEPLHAEVEAVLKDLEKQIDGHEHNGMTGVTREAYAKLPEAQRANHYTVNGTIAVGWMNHLAGLEAKGKLDAFVEKSVKIAQRRGYKAEKQDEGESKKVQENRNGHTESNQQEQPKKPVERQSVTAGGGGPTVTSGDGKGGAKKSAGDLAFDRMLGKGT